MLTYKLTSRVFCVDGDENFIFPNDVEIRCHLQPLQPFGLNSSGGKTVWEGIASRVIYDENCGTHEVVAQGPIKPLSFVSERYGMVFKLNGNLATIKARFPSLELLNNAVKTFYFCFPALLGLSFADPPYIVKVDGLVGDVKFSWQLEEKNISTKTTTYEQQNEYVGEAWNRLNDLIGVVSKRFDAALFYFHTACRLNRVAAIPGEFSAEALLNFSKVLEVLFPPDGDGKGMDAVRRELGKLGFTKQEIEKHFIPALALRNHVDVGHVELGCFYSSELRVVQQYVEAAEWAFRALFYHLIIRIQSGEYVIAPYPELSRPRNDAVNIIKRIKSSS